MSKSYEQLDLCFAGFIVSPSETFADTMRLENGWTTPGPDQQDRSPYLAPRDGVGGHIDAMQAFVTMTIHAFGFSQDPPSEEQVAEFVRNPDNKDAVGVYSFDDHIIQVAMRYLTGEGDCYRTLGVLANREGYDIFV